MRLVYLMNQEKTASLGNEDNVRNRMPSSVTMKMLEEVIMVHTDEVI